MTWKTKLIVIRWLVGLGCFVGGFTMLFRTAGGAEGGMAGAAGTAMLAFGAVIAGAVVLGRELAPWISAPIWRFITGIIFPDDHFDRPPVNYRLARRYREERRFADSIEQYLAIVQHHPQEADAYREGIEVMLNAGDAEGATKLRDLGLRKLRSRAARKELRRRFAALMRPAIQENSEDAEAGGGHRALEP